MELTILERIVLSSLFAQKEDIIYQKAVRDIEAKAGFSAEEIEEYKFEQMPEGGTKWRLDVPQEKEIDLSGAEKGIIVGALEKLNDKKEITKDHITLYEKFVE